MDLGKIKKITEKDFSAIIKNNFSLIEFGAPWCGACKKIEEDLKSLADSYNDDILFYKIDVNQNPGISSRYKIMSLPNILIFRKNKVIAQIIGATTKKDIESEIKKVLK